MPVVYRFQVYDIRSDEFQQSQRWGTLDAIATLAGGQPIGEGIEVEESELGDEVPGMTRRGYFPPSPQARMR